MPSVGAFAQGVAGDASCGVEDETGHEPQQAAGRASLALDRRAGPWHGRTMRLATTRFGDPVPGRVPVVIAHGLLGSGRNWHAIARALAAGGREVLTLDLRNHGASGWDARHDYPALAADLAETIAAEAGGRADLVGHSMGGKAAMRLALERPGMVRRLVVVDIAPIRYRHDWTPILEAMAALDLGRLRSRREAEEALAPAVPDPVLRRFLVANLVREGEALRWRVNLPALRRAMPDLLDWPPVAGRWEGPALLIRGARSDYVDAEGLAAMRRLFPGTRVLTVKDAGHWVHADRPEVVREAIAAFLDAPDAAKGLGAAGGRA